MNYQFRTKYTTRGFSLIELLVVIAIIGILTTVITVNFSLSREKAQNKSLIASLKETQLALELYKSQFGRYPEADSAAGTCSGSSPVLDRAQSNYSGSCSGTYAYIQNLAPEFIDALPRASGAANSDCVIQYYVDNVNNGSWYKLMATRCIANDVIGPEDEMTVAPSYCDGSQPGGRVYTANEFYESSVAVYSDGGECY